jgi:hypothetical protein
MRKVIVLGFLAMTVTFSGCKKYPEGPGFSLSSAMKRFAQHWALNNVTANGVDVTLLFTGVSWDIEDDGDYTQITPLGNILGTWQFNDDKTQAYFDQTATSQKDTVTILRLKKDECKLQQVDAGVTYVMQMTPKE